MHVGTSKEILRFIDHLAISQINGLNQPMCKSSGKPKFVLIYNMKIFHMHQSTDYFRISKGDV